MQTWTLMTSLGMAGCKKRRELPRRMWVGAAMKARFLTMARKTIMPFSCFPLCLYICLVVYKIGRARSDSLISVHFWRDLHRRFQLPLHTKLPWQDSISSLYSYIFHSFSIQIFVWLHESLTRESWRTLRPSADVRKTSPKRRRKKRLHISVISEVHNL